MKYDKFIILSTNELDWRINIQFALERLVERGVAVEYWNLSAITYDIHIETPIFDGIVYNIFNTKQSFFTKVDEYSRQSCLYLVYMNYTPTTYFVFRTLSRYDCDIAYARVGVNPIPPLNLIYKLKNYNFKRALKFRLFRYLLKTPLLKPAKYFLASSQAASSDYKNNKNTHILPFNSLDIIQAKTLNDDIVGHPYYVFIDQYLPYHSDSKASGSCLIPSESYYRQLNQLFDKIEKEKNTEIIIAAHPIAQRYLACNPFGERKLYFKQTHTLVKYSSGVIFHFSTACSYIPLYSRPSIALISDDLIKFLPIQSMYIDYYAKLLGVNVVNIDHIPSGDIDFIINFNKCKDYEKKYLRAQGQDFNNEDIIASIMNGDYE